MLVISPLQARNGSTKTVAATPTTVSRQVAKKYIAAGNASDALAMSALFAPTAVEVDKATGEVFRGRDRIASSWGLVFMTEGLKWRGNLLCAAPRWAVVSWVMSSSHNPVTGGPATTRGASVLDIKNGAITHETLYYDIPGR
jgi:hypothetical protein